MKFRPTASALLAATGVILSLIRYPPLDANADDAAQGRAFYVKYCAACHGRGGAGDGPAARALKQQPTDLRRLGEKYGTPLPVERISRFIDGRDQIAAHGSREMPVWGERFADIWTAKGSKQGNMQRRIDKIVTYLNSIQTTAHPLQSPAPAPVGMAPR